MTYANNTFGVAKNIRDLLTGDAFGPLSRPADASLLTAASATGAGVTVTAGVFNWSVYGTWDGATAQLQWSPDGGTTWIDFDGVSATANGGSIDVSIGAGTVRVSISGAGGSTSISSKLSGIA